MRYDGSGLYVISEHNALTLLTKLRHPGSARQIIAGDGEWSLRIEDDATHYADRKPGKMSPVTELDLEQVTNPGRWLESDPVMEVIELGVKRANRLLPEAEPSDYLAGALDMLDAVKECFGIDATWKPGKWDS